MAHPSDFRPVAAVDRASAERQSSSTIGASVLRTMLTTGDPAQLNVPQAESLTLSHYRVEAEEFARLTHSGDAPPCDPHQFENESYMKKNQNQRC